MNTFQKLVAIVGVSLFVGQANAVPVSLQDLIDRTTTSISAGAFTFSAFVATGLNGVPGGEGSKPELDPDYSLITVEAIMVNSETTTLQFDAQSELSIDPAGDSLFGDYIDMPISFQVDVASGYLSQAVGMDLTDSNVEDLSGLAVAQVGIYEQVFESNGGAPIGRELEVREDPFLGNIVNDSVAVLGYSSFWVEKNALITGYYDEAGDVLGGADIAEISAFTQTYTAMASSVPVPGTIVLMALGLAGVGRMRARCRG